MPRMTTAKRLELESFWRAHLDGWRRSELNQREYCELHGLPLKRFGNWRAKLRGEEPAYNLIRTVQLEASRQHGVDPLSEWHGLNSAIPI